MTFRKDDGFDLDAALANLVERYGVAAKPVVPVQLKTAPVQEAVAADLPAPVESVDIKHARKQVANKNAAKDSNKRRRKDSDSSDDESESDASFGSDDEEHGRKIKSKAKKEKSVPAVKKVASVPKTKVETIEAKAGDSKPVEATDEAEGAKVKKLLHCAVEGNRDVAAAILEMGTIYFKAGDPRKGGMYVRTAVNSH